MAKSTWQLPGIRNTIRRALCLHRNVCFGTYRDICYDCLAIIEERAPSKKGPGSHD